MMAKHDLVSFQDADLDGSACRIGIVKVRVQQRARKPARPVQSY